MAIDNQPMGFSHFTAAASYASNQYHLVNITAAATTVTLGSVLGQEVIGVLYNAPASGGTANVMTRGVVKVRYGGTVAIGDKLVCAASGEAVVQTLRDQYVIGVALEAGANDTVGHMVITHEGAKTPSIWTIPVVLSTLAADVVTTYTPGFAGRIVKLSAIVTTAVTTGSKAATLNLEINTTNLTGGSLVLSGTYALGAVVDATAITAANTFTASDSISLEAASITAFAEGAVAIEIVLN